jgi:hypothetical protein
MTAVQEKPIMEFTTLTEVNSLTTLSPVEDPTGAQQLIPKESVGSPLAALKQVAKIEESKFTGWVDDTGTHGPDSVPESCWDDGWEAVRHGNDLHLATLTVWSTIRPWWVQKRGRFTGSERELRAKILSVLFWLLDWTREKSYTGAFLYDPGEVSEEQWSHLNKQARDFVNLLRGSNKFLARGQVMPAFETLFQVFYPQFDEFFHTANAVLRGEEPTPYQRVEDSISIEPTPLDQPQVDYFDFLIEQVGGEG